MVHILSNEKENDRKQLTSIDDNVKNRKIRKKEEKINK